MKRKRPIPPAPRKSMPVPPARRPAMEEAEPGLPADDFELPSPRRLHPLPDKPPGIAKKAAKGPPLFIKIEKYQDVVNTLHKMKTFSLSLRDSLDALSDVEKELQHGISVAHKALDRFNQTISSLDTKISRLPPEEDLMPEEKDDIDEMESYVRNLHEQVQTIKRSLKAAEV